MLRTPLAVGALALAVAVSPAAFAQNTSATPLYGSIKLDGGTVSTPHTVNLTSGGTVDAWNIGNGNCRGYIADAPDYGLRYTLGPAALNIAVTAASDTTLVIYGPNGQWYCDDDSGGSLNPLVAFNPPLPGNYLIWVGSYGQGGGGPAMLSISETPTNSSGGGGGTTPPGGGGTTPPGGGGTTPPGGGGTTPPGGGGTTPPGGGTTPPNPGGGGGGIPPMPSGVNPMGNPLYGTVNLTGGSLTNAHTLPMTAGGPVDAYTSVGDHCRGYVAVNPDYVVQYTGGSAPLGIMSNSEADTTLVVQGPNGTFYCDDDSAGSLDPMLAFDNPQAGAYRIWVGTFSQNNNSPTTLSIYEEAQSAGLDPAGGPIYGSIALTSGFVPDPHTIQMTSGGPVDAYAIVGDQCRGYIAGVPDYRLDFTAGSGTLPLIISAGSDSDATLVIQNPDGSYTCDDDSGEGFNPSVTYNMPMGGAYRIWVGSYSSGGGTAATLSISELESL